MAVGSDAGTTTQEPELALEEQKKIRAWRGDSPRAFILLF